MSTCLEKSIVVIDDCPTDLAIVLRSVSKYRPDFSVTTYRDGVEAIRQLENAGYNPSAVAPSLILLDLKMPKMNGDEIARQLREFPHLSTVPIILFSSSVLHRDVANCLEAGCWSYVRKPLDYDEFDQAMSRIFDYWLDLHCADTFARPAKAAVLA